MVTVATVEKPKVLIVSQKGDWEGLLRLPSMLKRAGASVATLAPAHCKLRHSRHVDETFTVPEGSHTIVSALRDHLTKHQYTWVVLGDDPTLVSVADSAAHAGSDAHWIDGWFPIERSKGVELIFSKAVFTDACTKFDVPVPLSRTCSTWNEVRSAADEVGYPLMMKTAIGCAGNGVEKVTSADGLAAAWSRFHHRAPLVIQEFAVGRIGSTQMMFDHGKPICWVPAYKTVCFPEPYGPSCVRELLDQQGVDQMKPIVENVGKLTGFHGMCGIDWIRREDGSFAILEFNPRPTSTIHLGRLMGADCAVALKAMFAGQFAPQLPVDFKRSNRPVYMFPQHPKRCLRYREYAQLFKWIPGTAIHDVPWSEPRLVLSNLWMLTKIAGRRTRDGVIRLGRAFTAPAGTPQPYAHQADYPVHTVDIDSSEALV